MTIQSDLDTNRGVRRVLVKHWVDLGRLSVRSTQGRVLIRGRLLRIQGASGELTTPIVEAMFNDIRRLRGVRNVTAHLDNWIKDGGRWKEFERHATRVETKESVKSAESSVTIE